MTAEKFVSIYSGEALIQAMANGGLTLENVAEGDAFFVLVASYYSPLVSYEEQYQVRWKAQSKRTPLDSALENCWDLENRCISTMIPRLMNLGMSMQKVRTLIAGSQKWECITITTELTELRDRMRRLYVNDNSICHYDVILDCSPALIYIFTETHREHLF